MARRGGEGGGAGPMNTIIGGFVGLLVVVAIVILGPTLAGSIEAAVPALGATSDWNETHNTNLPNGSTMWTTNVTIGGVVIQSDLDTHEIVDNSYGCMYTGVISSSSLRSRSTTSGLSHNPDMPLSVAM